jgi:hypothetical protein
MPTLQWLNREGALGGADAAPYRLLVEDAGLSAGAADAGNMLVWVITCWLERGRFWWYCSKGITGNSR